MSQTFKGSGPNPGAPASGASEQAAIEASVRQLIANGKSKTALDKARDLHKTKPSAASEALLLDAYAARIQSLIQQNLLVEAKSLIELVRQRFPASAARLETLGVSVKARGGALDELVKPLNDPDLSADRRVAIEQALRSEVHDLATVASCTALPPEHSLRIAASALQRAFAAVTTRTAAEGDLALPEVSHRSPFAPWKLLVNAIDSFYRRDDESCRKYLDAIHPESVPARLIPAIRAMIDGHTHAGLTPASTALIEGVIINLAGLRKMLDTLDRDFDSDEETEDRILIRIRAAVKECRRTAPDQLEKLKQRITVRCVVESFERRSVESAIGGPALPDAALARMLARSFEEAAEPEDLAKACASWEKFRELAVSEGWFSPDGPEVSALYLHMAGLLGKLPAGLLREVQRSLPSSIGKVNGDSYYLHPETLYERACAIDPHSDAFSQWLEFSKGASPAKARTVAETWHKTSPQDLEPVLFLMDAAAAKSAFPTALKYLAKAEQIDGVHTKVRRARLLLLGSSAFRNLQQKKPHLAEERVREMAALPQSQQGDRPAMLEALRYLIALARGNSLQAAASFDEIERILGSKVAAELLIFGSASAAKNAFQPPIRMPRVLSDSQRADIPAAVARCIALVRDLNAMSLGLPSDHLDEAAVQVSSNGAALSTDQLEYLAQGGVNANHGQLAYAATAAGLERGGPTEAKFLLLRAKGLPDRQFQRRAACTAAALELARKQQDMVLVGEAVQSLHRFAPPDFSVTPDQAAEVLKKEKAEKEYPKPNISGPDYSELFRKLDRCQCAECRRGRGEDVEEEFDFEETDAMIDEMINEIKIPKGMPPELAKALLAAAVRADKKGMPIDDIMKGALGNLPPLDEVIPPWERTSWERKKGKRR